MSKLSLVVALVASAALAPMAAAQTVSDPDLSSGVPQVAMQSVAAMGAAPMTGARVGHWGGGANMGGQMGRPGMGHPGMGQPGMGRPGMGQPGMGHPGMGHPGMGRPGMGHPGMGRPGMGQPGMGRPGMGRPGHGMGQPGMGHHRPGFGRPGTHHGRFSHIPRINRGFFVPQFWWGPQFVINDWGSYGFSQPFNGGRWIRYYDDALLIDREGRVHDGRYGMDWDRYGDRWGSDGNGIPVYVGDGDYRPEQWDYEWAERYDRGEADDAYADDYDRDGPPPPPYPAPAYPAPAYGYGSAYGYGGCTCGPVVVTETIVTTPAVVEEVTYYEYETARPAPRRHSKRVKAHRIQPTYGEKG